MRVLVRLSRMLERTDTGLSLAQFRILELVSRGTERSTHIAGKLATSKPAVTVVVDGLVGAGLLIRSSHAGDRRVIRLALTDAGRDALARAEAAYHDRLVPLLDEISDPDALVSLLAEIDDAMDARWAARNSPRKARTTMSAPPSDVPAAATPAAHTPAAATPAADTPAVRAGAAPTNAPTAHTTTGRAADAPAAALQTTPAASATSSRTRRR